jgi:hypothetical protein
MATSVFNASKLEITMNAKLRINPGKTVLLGCHVGVNLRVNCTAIRRSSEVNPSLGRGSRNDSAIGADLITVPLRHRHTFP